MRVNILKKPAIRKGAIALTILPVVAYYFCLPEKLFNDPYSTVIVSAGDELLGATIAADGQWRFPVSDTVPYKFAEALVAFEDKRFWSHPGVDPLSMARAAKQNFSAGQVISGGSTLTMQVIRLSRKGKPRTWFEKLLEVVLATRLELRSTKREILALYSAHAPFGGNVVGLEAACWRYFGSDPRSLSWAQAALLAVLPNAPSMIHPGRNRALLKIKRDRLLDKLEANGLIDPFTCTLAKTENIPGEPLPLPRLAPHLLDRAIAEGHAGTRVRSTVNHVLQERVAELVREHHEKHSANHVYNAAAIVLRVQTGEVVAYVGNVEGLTGHGNAVDIVQAPRSTGSILKPILFAAMLDEGKILPGTIIPDIPTMINGFAPKNFSRQYDGAVPANKALIRSLNVPAVHMLREFRYEKFHRLLREVGMTTITQGPDHYGLSLILGGAEGTLWEVTGVYASMARTLNNYFQHAGVNRYSKGDFHSPRYMQEPFEAESLEQHSWLSAASIYLTFETLKELYRPGEETGWRHFSSSRDVAWKTGTSFGLRDAWAVGVTPEYAVGVWVGNADGEGRPGLTGTDVAAPLLFDIFSALPRGGGWFERPTPELRRVTTCRLSGYRASPRCTETDSIWITTGGLETMACPFHKTVHLTQDFRYRVHSDCASLSSMKHVNWFVLPPVEEYYYRQKNLSYHSLPPFRPDCEASSSEVAMDMVYPRPGARIFIPRNLDGQPGSSIFEVAHREPAKAVYWHLDGVYIGCTRNYHHLALAPGEGKHVLIIVDENGEAIERRFEVISEM